MNPFWHKTLLKTCFINQRIGKFLLLKILVKTMKKWGIYSPKRKLAVRLICQPDRLAIDRSVDRQGHKYDRWSIPVDRPVDRPDTESKALWSGRPPGRSPRYREQGSLVRSTARSTGPLCQQTRTCLLYTSPSPRDS